MSSKIVKGLAIASAAAGLFAMSAEEAGARVLFYATSARYSVKEGAGVPLPQGVEKATQKVGGVFLAGPKSDDAGKKEVLDELEKSGASDKVWALTQEVFEAAAARA